MKKYLLPQFENHIECENWFIRNINLEQSYVEVILLDSKGLRYSHIFNDVDLTDSIENNKTIIETLLNTFEV